MKSISSFSSIDFDGDGDEISSSIISAVLPTEIVFNLIVSYTSGKNYFKHQISKSFRPRCANIYYIYVWCPTHTLVSGICKTHNVVRQ